jgi:hypothetical protein
VRAMHNNSRLALACTELTTLFHKRWSRDGVSVNKTKKLGAVWYTGSLRHSNAF